MSGETVSRALEARFDEIRRTELGRLRRKLARLTEAEQASAETIIAEVINALAHVPGQQVTDQQSLAAIVHLFDLSPDQITTTASE